MARAMWKGTLDLEGIQVPIKLYSAVQDRSIHSRLLDAAHGEPVEQRMVHPESGEPVSSDKVHKGFPLEDGSFVLLEPDELASLDPPASRDIAISRFVPRGAVPRPFYVRPYYLGPDGANEAYFALARALEADKREGIAHWVMRKRAYHGVLQAADGYLTLITLRNAEEVIAARQLPRPEGRAHGKRELDMAEQLIEAYTGELDMSELHDEYRERVLALIEAKAAGKRPRLKKAREKREPDSLVDALQKSLKSATGGRRVA
jgi:DNA end-binding protein Ku